VLETLSQRNVVDLEVNQYKPTIARLKHLLARRFGVPPARVDTRTYAAFFDLLFEIGALYEWLLNADESFYRNPPDGPVYAGVEERRRWAAMREATMHGRETAKPPTVSASSAGWARGAAARFAAWKRAGRVTFVLIEVQGSWWQSAGSACSS
jgi:hypothetical protein